MSSSTNVPQNPYEFLTQYGELVRELAGQNSTWVVNQNNPVFGPRLRIWTANMVVRLGDLILPTVWARGTNNITDVSAWNVITAGQLGTTEPITQWPYAPDDVTVTSGTAALKAKGIYHVDASASTDGDGSQISPYNTVNSKTFTAKVVLLRKGTSANQTLSTLTGNQAASTWGWVTWYAVNQFEAEYASLPRCRLSITNTKNVVADGIRSDGNGATAGNGFSVITAANQQIEDVYLRNLQAIDVVGSGGNCNGLMITGSAPSDKSIKKLVVENFRAERCGGYGIGIESGNTDSTVANPIVIYNSIIKGNGSAKVSWGIGGYPFFDSTTNAFTKVGATCTYSYPVATSVVRVADHGGVFFKQLIPNTSLAASTCPSGQWAQSSNTLYVNVGADTGATLTSHTMRWSYSYCDGVLVTGCDVSEQTSPGASDASGIGPDTLCGSWVIDGNFIHDNYGSGIISNIANSTRAVNNVLRNNARDRDQDVVLNNGFGLLVKNNTILSNTSYAIFITNPNQASVVIDNVIYGPLLILPINTTSANAASTTSPNY